MNIIRLTKRSWAWLMTKLCHHQYKNIQKTSFVSYKASISNPDNLIMEENTSIRAGAVVLNTKAKFIMKKNSGAAVGLMVATGNHMSVVGMHYKQVTDKVKEALDVEHKMDRDVVVCEDVWIGCGVTLLSGVCIGRGCVIGAGSVVRKNTPPYSVVIGNPAKVVKFRFSPNEIIEHEKKLYEENDRLSLSMLEKNYEDFYLKRLNKINEFKES